ncbi:hypothetical protein LINGRAHAP2_LOCUS2957 [Linum grandiflorum]
MPTLTSKPTSPLARGTKKLIGLLEMLEREPFQVIGFL